MLFNPPGNKPVEELTFNGPVGPPHSYSHEVSNIGTLEGQAPPAGLLQPPFLAEARESGRAGRGRRGARHGAFSSAPLPSPCRIVYLRKVGSCQLDFRSSQGSQRLTFGVYEAFYQKPAP